MNDNFGSDKLALFIACWTPFAMIIVFLCFTLPGFFKTMIFLVLIIGGLWIWNYSMYYLVVYIKGKINENKT